MYKEEQFYYSLHNLYYLDYSDDIVKRLDEDTKKFHKKWKEDLEKMKKQSRRTIIKKWMIEWSWKVNIITFFVSSFCIIILTAIRILN